MVSLAAFPDFYPALPTLFQAFDFRSLIILILFKLIIVILTISIISFPFPSLVGIADEILDINDVRFSQSLPDTLN